MKAAAAVVGVALSSATALAHPHSCHEVSETLGHQVCSRFGAGWSGATLAWELGWTSQRMPLDAIDRDTVAGRATAAASVVDAQGLRLRSLYDLLDHFYVATELVAGRFAGPRLAVAAAPLARVMAPTDDTRGSMFGGVLAAGGRASLGPLVLRSELAFGSRFALFSDPHVPATLFGQGNVVLEARASASAWLSMHWSAGVVVATSLRERDDVAITVNLGLHALPFDGGR